MAFRESGPNGIRDCAVSVTPDDGSVRLQFDPEKGLGLTVAGNLGTLPSLDNSVCSVDLSGVTLMRQGNDLEIRLPMRFKPAFEGKEEILSWPSDP